MVNHRFSVFILLLNIMSTRYSIAIKHRENFRDVPIIGSAISNGLYRLVFSYRLSDRLVYKSSSRSDIIGRQLQVY